MISHTFCPECRSRAYVTRTNQLADTYREVTYRCGNPDCDMVFVASITPVRIIRRSMLDEARQTMNAPRTMALATGT